MEFLTQNPFLDKSDLLLDFQAFKVELPRLIENGYWYAWVGWDLSVMPVPEDFPLDASYEYGVSNKKMDVLIVYTRIPKKI